jgi:hypothetical protein
MTLGLKVIGIEDDFMLLLLGVRFDQKRIAEIVIMQVKSDLIVSVVVGADRLTDRDPRILNQDLDLGSGLPVFVAHETFDGESVIRFVRSKENRRKTRAQHTQREKPPGGRAANFLPAPNFPRLAWWSAACARTCLV